MNDKRPTMPDWIERLAHRMQGPLPGRAAQEPFAPDFCRGRHFDPPPEDARQAAVIMLLYPDRSHSTERTHWRIPLTLRPEHMRDHAGQISFPGGAIEPGETVAEAGLRELAEELGVTGNVRLLGMLTPIYLYVSHYFVTPMVGWLADRPSMSPDPNEVAQLLELPLDTLMDSRSHGRHTLPGRQVQVPHITCGEQRIWGATAIMLGELQSLLVE